jgi:hypothetical protein
MKTFHQYLLVYLRLGILSGVFFFLASCKSDSTSVPPTNGSLLIITPDTIVLTKPDAMKRADLKLTYGAGSSIRFQG